VSARADSAKVSLDELVGRYKSLRAAEAAGDLEAVGGIAKVIDELDRLYWASVERIVTSKVRENPRQMTFSEPERLIIDAGLLDISIVAGADDEMPAKLRREIRIGEEPGIYYLTEWLAERLGDFQVVSGIDEAETGDGAAEGALAKLQAERDLIYRKLAGLFRNMPGLTPQTNRLVATGRLDDQVQQLLFARSQEAARAEDIDNAVRRLESLYGRVLETVLSRARTDAEKRMVDRLHDLRLEIFRGAVGLGRKPGAPADSSRAVKTDVDAAVEFIRSEISLVRNLLKIGSVGGDIAQTHSVMLQNVSRATKDQVARVREMIGECDPRVELNQNILIAPFTGNGFFEWDRNTLMVSLIPARSVAEDVISAVANYRMLADNLYFEGELRRQYEAIFPNEKFHRRFLRDYKNWVLRIGEGRKEGIEPRAFEFFRANIGPSVTGAPLPRDLWHLSSAQKTSLTEKCRQIIREGRADGKIRKTLGLLLWARGKNDAAVRELERARADLPDDGLVLYALGVLYRRQRMVSSARKFLTECTRRAKNSIWNIYAYEERRSIL